MSSLASVEIGGESFPYKTESRCRVCASSQRVDVERAVAKGLSYQRIAETLGGPDGINARGVVAHVKRGHMPITAPAVRAVAKARSEEVIDVIAPLIRGVAANLGFAHAVVDRVRVRLDSGEVEPNVKDALAAARLIIECEAGSGPADASEWQGEMMAVFDVVKEIMSPAQFVEMGDRLNARNRERQATHQRY
jgi:hypothetical protein